MSTPRYLTTADLAERYRTSASTVRHWRTTGYGPAGIRVGKRVLYALDVVEAWDAAQAGHGDELSAHAAKTRTRRGVA